MSASTATIVTEDGKVPYLVPQPLALLADRVEAPPLETGLPQVLLPDGIQTIPKASEELFGHLARTNLFYIWKGEICFVGKKDDGTLDLHPISEAQFTSEIQLHVQNVKNTPDGKVPALINSREVKLLMASRKAREILPSVKKVVHRPILSVARGRVEFLHRGYHPDNGQILVLSEERLSHIDPAEAAANILSIIEGFCFASEADRARAVAMIMTIAMVDAGLLAGVLRPMFLVTAASSQSGKSLLVHVACMINEQQPLLLARKSKGGVGSFEESLGHGFASGRVLLLDNMRGNLNSEYLESANTARSSFTVRLPYQANVSVRLDEVTVTGTSNGVQLTQDQRNRILFINLRKEGERPEGSETEEQLLERIASRVPLLRSSIASIMASWLQQGRPSIAAPQSYRVEWSGIMNWMVQTQFGLPPLMENHGQIIDFLRLGNLDQLRRICRCISDSNQTGKALRANEVVDILKDFAQECEDQDLLHMDCRKLGRLMRSLLRGGNTFELPGWRITKITRPFDNDSRGEPVHFWRFDQVRTIAEIAVGNERTSSGSIGGEIPAELITPSEVSSQIESRKAPQNLNMEPSAVPQARTQPPRLLGALNFNPTTPSA